MLNPPNLTGATFSNVPLTAYLLVSSPARASKDALAMVAVTRAAEATTLSQQSAAGLLPA